MASFILREVEVSGALVTVTSAEVSTEYDTAKVFVSVFPSEKAADALKALEAKRGEGQTYLFKRLKMAVIPRISFEYDPGSEKAANIERITMGNIDSSDKPL